MSFAASIMLPGMPIRRSDLDAISAALTAAEYRGRLWSGHSFGVGHWQTFAYLSARNPHVSFGTAVSVYPVDTPSAAAVHAFSLSALSPEPPIIGIGEGHPDLVEHWYTTAGHVRAPRSRSGALRAFTQALQSETTHLYGDGALPYKLGYGVLRQRMATMAGAAADAAITVLCPPEYLRNVLAPALLSGAESLGRTSPPRLVIIVYAFDLESNSSTDPDRLIMDSVGAHLASPHYCSMLADAGLKVARTQQYSSITAIREAGIVQFGSLTDIARSVHDSYSPLLAMGFEVDIVVNVAGRLGATGFGLAVEESLRIALAINEI